MKLFKSTIIFFYLIAAFWIAFGVMWLFQESDYRWFYFTGALSNAIMLAILTYLMSRGRKWAYWLLVILLALNIILTITDQIGWFDLAYLVPAVAAFILILKVKKEVTTAKSEKQIIK
ncbi:MAG: hypothetical protein PHI73_04445 [Patescibacteria group bacterium]|nr:hypothetical protein [Patescibacteria group bacterium]